MIVQYLLAFGIILSCGTFVVAYKNCGNFFSADNWEGVNFGAKLLVIWQRMYC